MAALRSNIAKENGWGLAGRESVLPKWERRGRPEEMEGHEGELRRWSVVGVGAN